MPQNVYFSYINPIPFGPRELLRKKVMAKMFPNINPNGRFCGESVQDIDWINNTKFLLFNRNENGFEQNLQQSYHTGSGGYAKGFTPGTYARTQQHNRLHQEAPLPHQEHSNEPKKGGTSNDQENLCCFENLW